MKTLFAKSSPGRQGVWPDQPGRPAADMLPAGLLRAAPPRLPELGELDVVRHFTELSRRNFGVDGNFYPLGSCTMKYNPKFTEAAAALLGFAQLHPALPQHDIGETVEHPLAHHRGAEVPHHSGTDPQRSGRREDGGARVCRRTGIQPDHPAAVLVTGGIRDRPDSGDVVVLPTDDLGLGKFQIQVDQADLTAQRSGRFQQMAQLVTTEGYGEVRPKGRRR